MRWSALKRIFEFILPAADGVRLMMGTIGAGCLCAPILVRPLVNYLASDTEVRLHLCRLSGRVNLRPGTGLEFDLSFVITEPTPSPWRWQSTA